MQDSGSLAVFKVTARDQGHYKGPSGAFVTYCNISCFFLFFLGGRGGRWGEGKPAGICCPPTSKSKNFKKLNLVNYHTVSYLCVKFPFMVLQL